MEALSKAKLREFAALGRKAARQESGRYLVEGLKLCAEAFSAGLRPEALICTAPVLAAHPEWDAWPAALFVAAEKDLARISTLTEPEGAVAVFTLPVVPQPVPLIGPAFVVEGLADPGNLGTLWRTAAWYGFKALYAGPTTVEATNPKAIRGSMGACFRVPVYPVADMQGFVTAHAPRILATYVQHATETTDFVGRDWILLGSESHGLPTDWQTVPGLASVHIAPGPGGHGESLNAAVAGAILADRLVTGRWPV